MRHALMYHGAFESNFATLKPGATTFTGTDGSVRELHSWPESAYLRIGYMEKAGKNFCIVRVADAKDDVVVEHDVVIEPGRHVGFGVRFGPEPTLIEDDNVILTLLEDLVRKNPKQQAALMGIRERLKAVTKG